MKINTINNAQSFKGLLSFPNNKITLNPDNISDVKITESSFKQKLPKRPGIISYINSKGSLRTGCADEIPSGYYGGYDIGYFQKGVITMSNGDIFKFSGNTGELDNFYSSGSFNDTYMSYLSDKSFLDYFLKAKESDKIIELKDVLITKVEK